jgi:uncharacterized protein (DUF488 family)
MATLWSIGYEKTTWPRVRDTLLAAGVARVIDVRDLPLSRRPGFSKRQLAAGLEEAGMNYTHLRALGTPPEGREANRRRDWRRFWQIVDQRLATAEAALDLARAAGLATAEPCCLLCYEADPAICHRCRVADRLAASHGLTVQHLRVDPS